LQQVELVPGDPRAVHELAERAVDRGDDGPLPLPCGDLPLGRFLDARRELPPLDREVDAHRHAEDVAPVVRRRRRHSRRVGAPSDLGVHRAHREVGLVLPASRLDHRVRLRDLVAGCDHLRPKLEGTHADRRGVEGHPVEARERYLRHLRGLRLVTERVQRGNERGAPALDVEQAAVVLGDLRLDLDDRLLQADA
jgi:hypothetical protein